MELKKGFSLLSSFFESLARIPRFVNGNEWIKFSIELQNHDYFFPFFIFYIESNIYYIRH